MESPMEPIASEQELAAVCLGLGARRVSGWSPQEETLVAHAPPIERQRLHWIRESIRRGADPLGAAFCALRPVVERRSSGATYTPAPIVDAMVQWARAQGTPARIVDPGCGSGRFLMAAARAFPDAHLMGVEIDPLVTLMARANLHAAGLAARAHLVLADFRTAALEAAAGPTLFIGNPPYVRHHGIHGQWKRWLSQRAAARNLRASQLAGLHVHFFVATLERTRPGDMGIFVTAAEWLDVNYGQIVRDMLAGPLGCVRLDIIEPAAQVFADAQSTAVITGFRPGTASSSIHLRRVESTDGLAPLRGGRRVSRGRLASESRWTTLSRPARPTPSGRPSGRPLGLVELGELCHVHRGQVTGANRVWIAGAATPPLPPSVLFPAITRARELFAAGQALSDDALLRRVIDIPADLAAFAPDERNAIESFLRFARQQGAHQSYIARHRSPWWSVKLRAAPPILATYMARRPPAFVRNRVRARFINIAHGIYPRDALSNACLDALAAYLATSVRPGEGRTYAGGLTKFEPREMERLLVPAPDALATRAAELGTARDRACNRPSRPSRK